MTKAEGWTMFGTVTALGLAVGIGIGGVGIAIGGTAIGIPGAIWGTLAGAKTGWSLKKFNEFLDR